MNNTDEWIRGHDWQLEDIARDTDLAMYLVQLAAVLVLEGLPDEEIYELLRDNIISMDGQENPLAGAPQALERIRDLVTT